MLHTEDFAEELIMSKWVDMQLSGKMEIDASGLPRWC